MKKVDKLRQEYEEIQTPQDLDSFMDMPEKRHFTARMTDRLRTTVIPVPTV